MSRIVSYGENVLFFTPTLDNGFLSNLYPYPTPVNHASHPMHSAEQIFAYDKAIFLDDTETATQIAAAQSPYNAHKLGAEIKDPHNHALLWRAYQEECLLNVLHNKFTLFEDFRQALLATGQKRIIYANPYDKILGLGLSVQRALIQGTNAAPGLNLLGDVLMQVRDSLRAQDEVFDNAYSGPCPKQEKIE